jgi:SAM-dependent methyltransferase
VVFALFAAFAHVLTSPARLASKLDPAHARHMITKFLATSKAASRYTIVANRSEVDELLEYTTCLLCGAREAQPLFALPDALLGLPGTFFLVRCVACGLVYQNPRPTEAEIEAYYPPEYDAFVAPPWAHPNLLTRAIQLYGLKKRWALVERWAPRRDGKRTLLDIGCATGLFLAAGNDGWSKVGVELTADAAQYARHAFGLTVYQGTLEETSLSPNSFDAITMWDVLEHVHDPLRTLRRIRELLRPGGILVVRVPNLDAWDARLFGRYWAGLDQPRHIFVPDTASLAQMLDRAGFIEVERRCLSGSYGVLVLNWRFWLRERIANTRRRALARRVVDNIATRLALTPLLWVIDRIFLKGPLLTVVARVE